MLASLSLGFIPLLAAPPPALERFVFTEPHMGTRCTLTIYAENEAAASKGARAAFAYIAVLDGIMSDYRKASELMELCARAGGSPVRISEELYFVLEKSQALAERSEGAFDVTIGPVVREWRFARKNKRLPDADELKAARALVGYKNLLLDPKHRTAELKKPDMLLDLGGIAKGYAADQAARVLRDQGLTRVLVALGGDIVAGDAPPGEKAWSVEIAPIADGPRRKLPLVNQAVSTSGDANQYVEIDGKRYSHVVDPRTGIGLIGRSSVTVIARRGIDSDGLDTAAAVLGPEKGLKLIEQTPGAEGLFVRWRDGKEETYRTKGFPEKSP